MEFTTLSTWNEVAQWYWKLASPQTVSTKWIKATVDKLIAGKTTDVQKAQALYNWMIQKVRYVGVEFGISAYKPHPASEVHSKLYGDCKDKATLLITMLGVAGIKAYPVLLHTETRRNLHDQLPIPTSFNHCIVLADIGGKETWLDPTDEDCAFGDIPVVDRGSDAFVVRAGAGEFRKIPTYTVAENGVSSTIDIRLQADGSAEATSDVIYRGGFAQVITSALRSLSRDQREQMMQEFAQRFMQGSSVVKTDLPDTSDPTTEVAFQIKTKSAVFGKRSGSLMLIPSAFHTDIRSNPYTKETRNLPISSRMALGGITVVQLHLPPGYRIEELPKDLDIEGPLVSFHRKCSKAPDGMSLTIRIDSAVRDLNLPVTEYSHIRADMEAMLHAVDEQIVLRKLD